MRSVCVIGVGHTKYGNLPFTARELAVQASQEAIMNAEIEPRMIQGAFVANAFSLTEKQMHLGPTIMGGLGIPDAPCTSIEAACSSGAAAFREAYVNIGAGVYDVALAIGTERVMHMTTATATTYFSFGSDYTFEGACGFSFPGLYAAIAQAHMKKYGTTPEQLAAVAVKNHKNAMGNSKAHFHREITIQDVLKSPMIASPLKLLDCCPFSDGAAAVILCAEETARKYTDSLIRIIGSGRAGGTSALQHRDDVTSLRAARLASKQAFEQSGLQPRDIDLAEVHDCFTIAEIVAMEDLGFAEPGKAARMVEEERTGLKGEIPINTSGGLKAKGHPVAATGIGQIAELYEQLMGRAGSRQVQNAEIGLAHNVGATGGSCAVHILRRG